MEPNISVTSYDMDPRISRQVPVSKDRATIEKAHFNASQKKSGKVPAAHTKTMTMKSLYSNSLFQETQNVEPPRQRYRRRNSAVASMLFSSATTAAATSYSSSEGVQSLRLSTALRPMDPAEALSKAKELLKNLPGNAPTRRDIATMKKRASAPWSTKYYIETDQALEESQKRQRTSESAHS